MKRIFEAIALASVILNLIPQFNIPLDYGYFLAMFVLGLGSIPMCWILFKHRITPKWLAIWGAIGYAVFALGFLMELFGKHWSMYLLSFGGLWELTRLQKLFPIILQRITGTYSNVFRIVPLESPRQKLHILLLPK